MRLTFAAACYARQEGEEKGRGKWGGGETGRGERGRGRKGRMWRSNESIVCACTIASRFPLLRHYPGPSSQPPSFIVCWQGVVISRYRRRKKNDVSRFRHLLEDGRSPALPARGAPQKKVLFNEKQQFWRIYRVTPSCFTRSFIRKFGGRKLDDELTDMSEVLWG